MEELGHIKGEIEKEIRSGKLIKFRVQLNDRKIKCD